MSDQEQAAVGDQGDAAVAGYIAAAKRIEREIGAQNGFCLDVGANTGTGMDALRRRWPHSTWLGLEPVEKFADAMRGIILGCAETMPFADERFDFIFCRHCLEHVRYRSIAIDQMERVLRRGGYLYLQVPIEPGGSANPLHRSPFRSGDEVRFEFRRFQQVYWGPQETVVELIARRPAPGVGPATSVSFQPARPHLMEK